MEEKVDTLEHLEDDNKEVETTSEVENTQSDTANQEEEKDSSETIDNNIDDSTLGLLSDEEFFTFMDSGKLPEDIETRKFGLKEDKSNEEEIEVKTTEKVEESEKESSIKDEKEVKSEVADKQDIPDYKSIYDSIFKGFKANGKDIVPRTVEEVISLMQMGANYTKKMQTVAPMRKTVESLNKANINETELNFLIDIHNGDKEAIKKLLAKHKVDPMELDLESTNYVPKNNIVSDADVKYSSVLDDIQESLPRIQEIMNKQWDNKSKELLLTNDELLLKLHQEIQLGRFDEVQSRLELEKTFGRYSNMPDIAAYSDIVTKMVTEQQNVQSVSTSSKSTNTSKKDIPDKKGAAPTKVRKANTINSNITPKDIFDMSDEDFKKLSAGGLY